MDLTVIVAVLAGWNLILTLLFLWRWHKDQQFNGQVIHMLDVMTKYAKVKHEL
jgi:hypothetical protein